MIFGFNRHERTNIDKKAIFVAGGMWQVKNNQQLATSN
jgi:hypothetical protein